MSLFAVRYEKNYALPAVGLSHEWFLNSQTIIPTPTCRTTKSHRCTIHVRALKNEAKLVSRRLHFIKLLRPMERAHVVCGVEFASLCQ